MKQPPTSSFVGWTLFSLKIILFSEVKKCKVSESRSCFPSTSSSHQGVYWKGVALLSFLFSVRTVTCHLPMIYWNMSFLHFRSHRGMSSCQSTKNIKRTSPWFGDNVKKSILSNPTAGRISGNKRSKRPVYNRYQNLNCIHAFNSGIKHFMIYFFNHHVFCKNVAIFIHITICDSGKVRIS